ncbi:MAG TPA: GTP cyclohydrolase I FolE [Saprospiraceae bacterium]|nr:GTP cyclohydrolase I FolE [Saprospiraceae bacterium]
MHKINVATQPSHEESGEDFENPHFTAPYESSTRTTLPRVSEEEKMKIIENHFTAIMETLGLDLSDDSLSGTPKRIAKMYVKEKFWGLDEQNQPSISLFQNTFQYRKILIEKNINVQSTCEHHFLPIFGKAHIGYISSGKVIGLSKLNRIVDYFSRRPQVQERLTRQILIFLQEALDTPDVIVVIDARHMCVISRGIEDTQSSTITMDYGGVFINQSRRSEFMGLLKGGGQDL